MIIVSGLARSGTSLMMRMLEAGGIQILTDGIRQADDNNLHGYREVKAIGKKLADNNHYLVGKKGCCKILSPFLRTLQGDHRIIYMERNLEEVAASMEKMSGTPVTSEQQAALGRHVESMKEYLKDRNVLYISYNKLVTDPRDEVKRLQSFVPELDMVRSLGAIDKSQYRNRK